MQNNGGQDMKKRWKERKRRGKTQPPSLINKPSFD